MANSQILKDLFGGVRNTINPIGDTCRVVDELDGPAVHFGVWSWKLSNVGRSLDGWPKIYYIELLRASQGTLSRWSRLHLQLVPTNLHWVRVVGYGLFSLCVIQNESLCPSSGINRLMMMILCFIPRRKSISDIPPRCSLLEWLRCEKYHLHIFVNRKLSQYLPFLLIPNMYFDTSANALEIRAIQNLKWINSLMCLWLYKLSSSCL
jgi:hypothetical protein